MNRMWDYISKSIGKFRQDALSKFIYDIGKYVGAGLLTLFLAKIIPADTSFSSIINKSISLTVINFTLLLIISIVFTLLSTRFYLRKKFKKLQEDTYTDELTGLLNEKAFKDLMPKTIEICRKQNIKLSLIIIDIDDFKLFNKQYNYQIANKVLSKVGTLLKSDSRATDITFRQFFKGDSFKKHGLGHFPKQKNVKT
ncbi:GGDEF domain-containing protein [Niastella caeni]|uniref:diguanylate cyclase n=1 Tax=Niastella caeni TaxID=2569763 RepID=A0A4S8HDK1_9BACT|nr:GGDEF domain-containing protein [Niastella caeni]THU33017.1 GGDEF domain-containing protein [Niastella caeni]